MTPGTHLATWEATAEPGKVAEFARAVRRPSTDTRLPPTFLVVLAAPFIERLVTEILPVDRARVLHGSQRFEWLEEVHAGVRLRAMATLVDITEKQSRTGPIRVFEIETLWHHGDNLICRDTSVILDRVAP